jgi:hypothetical protein
MVKRHYYVYYSYESWGRGYIGRRSCKCLPEEDVYYFGSFRDKSFVPDQKTILQTFKTEKEAIEAEIYLHNFYQVDINPHFANKAKQTSVGFCFSASGDKNPRTGKIGIFHHTDKAKKAISRAHKGKTWWTNGTKSILAFECPNGFIKGRNSASVETKKKQSLVRLGNRNHMYGRGGKTHPLYGKRWFTNGTDSVFLFDCPPGFYRGRTLKKKV